MLPLLTCSLVPFIIMLYAQNVMKWFKDIIEAIFPESCVSCGRKGSTLCAICERTIIAHPTLHGDWLTTLYNYHQPLVKKCIQDLKFNNRKGIAIYFGNAIYREFFSQLARKPKDAENIVLIPIPGSAEGNARRGYNHASEIASVVYLSAVRANLPMSCETDVLYKKFEIGKQSKADGKSAREKNIKGVFAVKNENKIIGKHVVIIDDVMTTGETMSAAREALLAAGAKKVIGIAVAH